MATATLTLLDICLLEDKMRLSLLVPVDIKEGIDMVVNVFKRSHNKRRIAQSLYLFYILQWVYAM